MIVVNLDKARAIAAERAQIVKDDAKREQLLAAIAAAASVDALRSIVSTIATS